MLLLSIPYDLQDEINEESKYSGKTVKEIIIETLKEKFGTNEKQKRQDSFAEFLKITNENHHSSNGEKWSREEIYER